MPYVGDSEQEADIFKWMESHQDVQWIIKRLKEAYDKKKEAYDQKSKSEESKDVSPPRKNLHSRTVYRYAQIYRERLKESPQLSTDKLTLANISTLSLDEPGLQGILDLIAEMDAATLDGVFTWPFVKVNVDEKGVDKVAGNEITVNEAKWFARLQPLSPGLSMADVVLLAGFCDYKERAAVALDLPSDDSEHLYDDVLKYLAFRPWQDDASHKRYVSALASGTAKPIDYIALMGTAFCKLYMRGVDHLLPKSDAYSMPGFEIDYPGQLLEYLAEDEEQEIGPHPDPMMYLALAKVDFFRSSKAAGLSWDDIPPFRYDYSKLDAISQLKRWDFLGYEALDELGECLSDIPDPHRGHIQLFVDSAGKEEHVQ